MGDKEHGLYVSSTPSSAAKKAVTKLLASNKSKKLEFCLREITQGSKKKTYGPYLGHIEKLKKPIELKGRVIKYKPVVKLSKKKSGMKGGGLDPKDFIVDTGEKYKQNTNPKFKYEKPFFGAHKIFFGKKISLPTDANKQYFSIVLYDDGSFGILNIESNQFKVYEYSKEKLTDYFPSYLFPRLDEYIIPNSPNVHNIEFSDKMKVLLDNLRKQTEQVKQQKEQQKLQQEQLERDKRKIILKSLEMVEGSDNNIYLTFLLKGREFPKKTSDIQRTASYLLFNETLDYPIGNFSHLIYNERVRNNVIESLRSKNKIVIKISPDGTLTDLLGTTSSGYATEANLSTNSKLNKSTFNTYIGRVENRLTPKNNNE